MKRSAIIGTVAVGALWAGLVTGQVTQECSHHPWPTPTCSRTPGDPSPTPTPCPVFGLDTESLPVTIEPHRRGITAEISCPEGYPNALSESVNTDVQGAGVVWPPRAYDIGAEPVLDSNGLPIGYNFFFDNLSGKTLVVTFEVTCGGYYTGN